MRCGLALLIAVVQVAGSWLCCCGPERFFASPAPVRVIESRESADRGTCPHCKPSQTTQPTKPSEPTRKPTLPDQCPCCGVSLEVPQAVLTTPYEHWLSSTSAFALDATFDSLVAANLHGVALDGVAEGPFMPAQCRLFVHHVLRC